MLLRNNTEFIASPWMNHFKFLVISIQYKYSIVTDVHCYYNTSLFQWNSNSFPKRLFNVYFPQVPSDLIVFFFWQCLWMPIFVLLHWNWSRNLFSWILITWKFTVHLHSAADVFRWLSFYTSWTMRKRRTFSSSSPEMKWWYCICISSLAIPFVDVMLKNSSQTYMEHCR